MPNAQIKILNLVEDKFVMFNYQFGGFASTQRCLKKSLWGKKAFISNANTLNMKPMKPGVLWCLIFTENVSLRRSVCSPPHTLFFGTFWLRLVPLGRRCHHIGSCLPTCNASQPWKKKQEQNGKTGH